MPFRKRFKKHFEEGFKQIKDGAKTAFQRKVKGTSRPNIPSSTLSYANSPLVDGQSNQDPGGSSYLRQSIQSDDESQQGVLGATGPSPHDLIAGSQPTSKNLEVPTQQVISQSQASEQAATSRAPQFMESGRMPCPTQWNVSNSGDHLTSDQKHQDLPGEALNVALKGLKTFAAGVMDSATDAFKFGPLQDISDVFQSFMDTYTLDGTVKEEYKALQQNLQALLNVLDRHTNESTLSVMAPKVQGMRQFIEAELNSIRSQQSGNGHGRLIFAKQDEERFLACSHRIQVYVNQLSLDTNLKISKIEVEQSKARMSSLVGRLPSSASACYDSSAGAELKRRECTPGTRVKVLANLLGWTSSNSPGGVYWLNGMAGTGKTTISYSVCKELDTKLKLGASFFCSRLREECRNVNVIIPSIAYQLAYFSQPFQSALLDVLEKERDIHTKRLDIQFKALIQEPLLSAKDSLPDGLVVVIDALDECENKESTMDMLDVLLNEAGESPIKFIVSSRPEPQIRDQMTDERVKSRLVLHELDTGSVQVDIETYLRAELKPMKPLPTETQIAALVEKAGVLFIYAATAVRYIGYGNFRRNPSARLRTVLGGSESRQRTREYEEIDQLYMRILEAALDDPGLNADERDDMEQVLHMVICARDPLTVEGLSELLRIQDVERVRAALEPLGSVIHVVGGSEVATTLHASFPDFMVDSSRSKTYHCDSEAQNRKLVELCFGCIARAQPQFNICGLESSHLPDGNVQNMQGKVEKAISSELFYACRYWADHVEAGKCGPTMVDQLIDFLSNRLLLWMEVLNLKGQMKAGMDCMKLTVEWCNQFKAQAALAELAEDAKRFVETFALNPVSQSTPHIYASMLALWPRSAPIVKYYERFTPRSVKAEGTGLDRRQLAHLSTWAFDGSIYAMSVSADASYIGLGIGDNVLVVDSSSGRKVLGPLKSHENVRSIAFSPDGTCLFSGSYLASPKYATILGWDTRTGDRVLGPLQLDEHTDTITCLSHSPDGTRIATGSSDETVRLWDAENGRMLHCLAVQGPSYDLVFSPDGTRVASAVSNTLHVWDSQTGDITLDPLTYTEHIMRIAFSPDNSRLIGGTHSLDASSIHVWDTQSGETIFGPIQTHTESIQCIRCSPDGRYIVSGSYDGTIRVWDAQDGNMVLGPLEAHTSNITSVAFSLDSSRIISACWGGLVCTWDAQQRNLTSRSINARSDGIACVKFSSDGTRFVSGSWEGTVSIWDAQTGEMKVGPIKAHTSPVYTVDFLNDRVVSGSDDGAICVCDALSGGVVLGPLKIVSGTIGAVAYSPSGKMIATGSDDGVDVWDAQNGSRVLGPLTDLDGWVLSIQFSPDGTHIVGGSKGPGRRIVVWDVADGKNVFGSLDGHSDGVNSVSYSPDGALIASGSHDDTIIVWNAYTGQKAIGPLTGHSDHVRWVGFSPDSTRLVSGSDDRKIWIWDVQTGEMMFELLHGHEEWIRSVEYSPDGTRILSCSDGSVRIHDARSPEERALSRPASEVGDWTMNKDGWVVDDQSRLLVWVPGDLRNAILAPSTTVARPDPRSCGYIRLKFDESRMGESWAHNYMSEM